MAVLTAIAVRQNIKGTADVLNVDTGRTKESNNSCHSNYYHFHYFRHFGYLLTLKISRSDVIG